MRNRVLLFVMSFMLTSVLLMVGCVSKQQAYPKEPIPTYVSLAKDDIRYFMVGNERFRFVGAFVLDWEFSQSSADNLTATAKMAGLDVLTLMLPYSETIGDEASLSQLDIFLDRASAHDIRVIVTLVQGVSIAKQKTHPFHNAGGVEGLIRDGKIKSDYKDLIKRVVTHVNTVNGKPYRDDDTIMAWDLISEPIPSPMEIPKLPDITMEELGFWAQEMVDYTKSFDPNHLVTMMLTGSVNYYKNWPVVTKELDFLFLGVCVYDILYGQNQSVQSLEDDYLEKSMNYPIFSIGKPVVTQIDFTSAWLTEKFAADHNFQGQFYKEALQKGFQSGIAGATIFCWGTKELAKEKGDLISLYLTYDATDKEIIIPIMEIVAGLPMID